MIYGAGQISAVPRDLSTLYHPVARSIRVVKMKTDEGMIKTPSLNPLMAYSTDPDYVERNIHLVQILHIYPLRPSPVTSWIGRSPAQSIRLKNSYSVDHLGTLSEVPFASHGYGSHFALSLLDRYHNPAATLEDGLETLKRCIYQVAKCLVVSPGKY